MIERESRLVVLGWGGVGMVGVMTKAAQGLWWLQPCVLMVIVSQEPTWE